MSHRTARLGFVGVALAAAVLLFSSGPVHADDDVVGNQTFQFGRRLAAEGKRGIKSYFAYARRVYEGLLKDDARSDQVKDLARFGLADLNSEAAIGAMQREVPYKEVVRLLREACDALEEFANKYPNHPNANDAKLKVGTTRLGFVQWARDSLLWDPAMMDSRGTDEEEVARDAKTFVGIAINHFDKLRVGHDSRDPTDLAQRAQYSWVLSQFYRALVLPPCSSDAMEAFDEAEKHLDEFALLNDGTLVGVYALDILGLNWEEKAKCASDEDEKLKAYQMALQNYQSCMSTDNLGPEYLRLITNGYYHFARACLAAGRIKGRDFLKIGVQRVGAMLQQQPQAWRTSNGVRALIELGLLHGAREHTDKAVDTLTLAAEKAKAIGNGFLERKANDKLKELLSGGSMGKADPEVLKRVADSLYADKKWAEAALGYKQVSAAAPRTEQAYKAYLAEAWTKMSACYSQMGDLLGAALALEPLHEAWVDGVFSYDGTETHPNLIAMGDQRDRAIRIWRKLGDMTQSRVYQSRAAQMLRDFKVSYEKHPRARTGIWQDARQTFNRAVDEKRTKKSGWRKTLGDAERAFVEVSKDPKSQDRHAARVYLIQSAYLRSSTDDMIKIGNEALTFWKSKEVLDQAKEFPTVAGKIKDAKGKVRYWLSNALVEKSRWDDVLTTLDGYHVDHENLKGKGAYFPATLGNLIKAHLGKSEIAEADKYYDRLVKVDPGYSGLPGIAQHFANYYNAQAKSIEEQLRELVREVTDLKPKLTVAERKEYAMFDSRSNTRARLTKAKDAVKVYETARDAGQLAGLKGLTENQYNNYKKSIPDIEKELGEIQSRINQHSTELEKMQTRTTEALGQIEGLKGQLYEPRARAAGYFYGLYRALVEAKKAPIPSNVKVFGDLYRRAAKLKPEVRENWDRARELYEAFIKMKGAEKESVQEATGYLGSIYYRLATTTEDEKERRDLVQLARDRLQSSIAKVKDNVPLLLAQLVGDYGVLPWRSDVDGQKYMIALPKGIKSVQEFKRLVATLGTPGGPVMYPKFEREAQNNKYKAAIDRFKAVVGTDYSDRDLKRTVKSFARPSTDWNFFALHGNKSRDFRLALAWVYSATGDPADYPKGIALANGLIRGPLALPESDHDWWQARSTLLEALVSWAERARKTSSGLALAKTLTERASKSLVGLKTSFPSLGKNDRPQTPAELQGLLKRIERLRTAMDLPLLNLDLVPKDAVGDVPDDE